MNREFDLIIVGTGLAGYGLVEQIRQVESNLSIFMLTQDDGSFYSKPILSTGFSNNLEPSSIIDYTAEEMAEKLNIEIKTFVKSDSINTKEKLISAGGYVYRYNKLVLAQGALPVHLEWPVNVQPSVFYINNLSEYQDFRESLKKNNKIALVGSGLVGMEYANDLAASGMQVHVISVDNYPLEKLIPYKLGNALKACLEKINVNFHLDTKITDSYVKTNGEISITTENGEQIDVDIILSAAGLRPNIQLAKSAELNIGYGIKVNSTLQTSDESIYAIGDCAEINGDVRMFLIPINLSIKSLANTLTNSYGLSDEVNFPLLPVLVKTSACPIFCVPPPVNVQGNWKIDGEENNLKGCFFDNENNLKGFALMGSRIRERVSLIKECNQ
ncbi:FAD-dependent oxidoreductase [Photobacterium sp. SP02]|uniref:FAD-dependent oxidoreductase n=1 Tax=Photobacterium sp. SP02 TaxID=3032280 RepID=UPI0031456D1F